MSNLHPSGDEAARVRDQLCDAFTEAVLRIGRGLDESAEGDPWLDMRTEFGEGDQLGVRGLFRLLTVDDPGELGEGNKKLWQRVRAALASPPGGPTPEIHDTPAHLEHGINLLTVRALRSVVFANLGREARGAASASEVARVVDCVLANLRQAGLLVSRAAPSGGGGSTEREQNARPGESNVGAGANVSGLPSLLSAAPSAGGGFDDLRARLGALYQHTATSIASCLIPATAQTIYVRYDEMIAALYASPVSPLPAGPPPDSSADAWRKRCEEAEAKLLDLGEKPYTLEQMQARTRDRETAREVGRILDDIAGPEHEGAFPCIVCGARTGQHHAATCTPAKRAAVSIDAPTEG